jgi:hypothetical protein
LPEHLLKVCIITHGFFQIEYWNGSLAR